MRTFQKLYYALTEKLNRIFLEVCFRFKTKNNILINIKILTDISKHPHFYNMCIVQIWKLNFKSLQILQINLLIREFTNESK